MKKVQVFSVFFFLTCQFAFIAALQPFESSRLTRDSTGEDIEWQTSLIDIIRSLEKQISTQNNEIESLDDQLEESDDKITSQNQRISDLENCNCQSIGDEDLLGCNADMGKKIKSLEDKAFNQKKAMKKLKEEKLEQADKIKELEDSIKKQKPEHDELIEAVDELKTTSEYQGKKLDDTINRIDQLQISGSSLAGDQDVCKKTGDELAQMMKKGTRVVRGEDWSWGDQDGNPPGEGTVIAEVNVGGWVRVKWDSGHINGYQMGSENNYDLKLAQCV